MIMATASRGVKPHTGRVQGVIRKSPLECLFSRFISWRSLLLAQLFPRVAALFFRVPVLSPVSLRFPSESRCFPPSRGASSLCRGAFPPVLRLFPSLSRCCSPCHGAFPPCCGAFLPCPGAYSRLAVLPSLSRRFPPVLRRFSSVSRRFLLSRISFFVYRFAFLV